MICLLPLDEKSYIFDPRGLHIMYNKLLIALTSCALIMGLAACSSNETASTSNDSKSEAQKEAEKAQKTEEKAKQEEQQRQEQEQARKQQTAQAQKQREVKQQKKEEPELCGSPEVRITCEHVQKEWENEQKIEAEQKAPDDEYNKSHQLSQEVANKIVIGSDFMKYDSILPLPSDAQVGVGGTEIYIYKQGNKQLRMIVNKHDQQRLTIQNKSKLSILKCIPIIKIKVVQVGGRHLWVSFFLH
ncbi:hypothetical protein [Bacillus cereus]|uniref:hypothetical protein n=2 Tax=Bacillus TaxID=1386 RepID=UPI001E405585|nr:hypothetical protein [Bacillus cereus]